MASRSPGTRLVTGLVQRGVRGLVQSLHSCAPASSEAAAVTKVSSRQNQLAVSRITTSNLPLHNGRLRVCVLGTGWGAARFLATIDPKLFNITMCLYTPF